MIDEILNKIKQESLSTMPNESCGFIISDSIFYPCQNAHEKNKKEHFKINAKDYLKASQLGKVSHIFHSHTTWKKEFSILDKTISEEFKISLILYHVPDDSFLFYSPNGFKNPYIGKKFKWGKYDCFSIVKLYYKQELGIEINEEVTERGRDFFRKNFNLFNLNEYLKIAERNNLDVLPKSTKLIKNDILLFRNPNNIDYHFGVYLDDNSYIHVPDSSVSQLSILSEEKLDNLYSVIRTKKTIQ